MGLRILIAEDDPKISEYYYSILTKVGHDVTITKNGYDCLKNFFEDVENSKTPYDVVILDYAMPKLHGIEAAKQIHKKIPDQRIIFVTAFEKELLRESPLQLKNIEIIQKPFSLHSFLRIVQGKKTETIHDKELKPLQSWDDESKLLAPNTGPARSTR